MQPDTIVNRTLQKDNEGKKEEAGEEGVRGYALDPVKPFVQFSRKCCLSDVIVAIHSLESSKLTGCACW